jgi:hypothetical protein
MQAAAPAKKPAQEVATTRAAPPPMIVAGDSVPDYIKQDGARGQEGVGIADLVVPRIEVAQALSPCLDESNEAAYIEGAKQGNLFNSLTRMLYGQSVLVVPVLFNKQFLLWRDRDSGGGFRGAYDSPEEANKVLVTLEKPDEWEAIDTGQHLVLVVRADGVVEEAMMSLARTKMKVSRQWNSLVRQAGGDRFSRAYEVVGVKEKNTKNQDYFNFSVRPVGFPTQAVYEQAAALYENLKAGKVRVQMDTSDVDDGTAGGGKSEF